MKVDFDEIWQKYSKYFRIEFACFIFYVGLLNAFLSTFRLSNHQAWTGGDAMAQAGYAMVMVMMISAYMHILLDYIGCCSASFCAVLCL